MEVRRDITACLLESPDEASRHVRVEPHSIVHSAALPALLQARRAQRQRSWLLLYWAQLALRRLRLRFCSLPLNSRLLQQIFFELCSVSLQLCCIKLKVGRRRSARSPAWLLLRRSQLCRPRRHPPVTEHQ